VIAYQRRASAILFNLLLSRGDRRPFLIPANVCPAVPETFSAAGQRFELVDITEPWLEIDVTRCLELVRTTSIAGVVLVRPYGSQRDPSRFFAALRKLQPDLLIIDDKCLCAPDPDGISLSALADATLFSTGRAKYVDLGGGGFAHLRTGVPYRRGHAGPTWLDLRSPGLSWRDYRSRVLAALQTAAAHKRELNSIYSRGIPRRLQLPADLQEWRFNIRTPDADRLVATLFARGLFASRHYPALGELPVAARLHREIVNLFNDFSFTAAQASLAADIVRQHRAS
jgi:hypothetical protein